MTHQSNCFERAPNSRLGPRCEPISVLDPVLWPDELDKQARRLLHRASSASIPSQLPAPPLPDLSPVITTRLYSAYEYPVAPGRPVPSLRRLPLDCDLERLLRLGKGSTERARQAQFDRDRLANCGSLSLAHNRFVALHRWPPTLNEEAGAPRAKLTGANHWRLGSRLKSSLAGELAGGRARPVALERQAARWADERVSWLVSELGLARQPKLNRATI